MPLLAFYFNAEYATEILSLQEFFSAHNSQHLFPQDVVFIGVSRETFQQILRNSAIVDAIVSNRLLPLNNPQRWVTLAVSSLYR